MSWPLCQPRKKKKKKDKRKEKNSCFYQKRAFRFSIRHEPLYRRLGAFQHLLLGRLSQGSRAHVKLIGLGFCQTWDGFGPNIFSEPGPGSLISPSIICSNGQQTYNKTLDIRQREVMAMIVMWFFFIVIKNQSNMKTIQTASSIF